MTDKEEAVRQFSADHYATDLTGITIDDAKPGYARCSLIIKECHRNALGAVMGGALFTLADYAFAIASNLKQPPTVSLSSTIEFLNSSRGTVLTAETRCLKSGRNVCIMDVLITDDQDCTIASVHISGMRVHPSDPKSS